MTFATMSVGLIPILWSTGTGSEIMKRIAAPMVGGIVTSFLLELLVYPAIYAFWRERDVAPEPDSEFAGGSRPTTSYLELGAMKNRGVVPVSE
jgi:Cu(I)/Ag(I) efflux system membrane protein CusA/SilA